MWYEILKFEIQSRIKRPDTYIFFAVLFLFSIVAFNFIYQGEDLGQLKENSPYLIARTMVVVSIFFMLITSIVMGTPVLRDFQCQMESLLFVNPIKKIDYLLGRFLGSFIVLILVFSALLWGMIVGEFMPWRDTEQSLPFSFWAYLKPFLILVLPILFLTGSIFFVSGALSKKLLVVYTQGIFIFVLFLFTQNIENEFLAAILDPFSLSTLSFTTEYWTTAELNLRHIPLLGVLFYNKLFGVVVGIFVLVGGYYRFSFNVVTAKFRKSSTPILNELVVISNYDDKIPDFILTQGVKMQWVQLVQHSLFYFKFILKEVSFWAIVICGMVIIMINSIHLGTVYGVNSYPATYFIIEELQEMSIYFFIIILVFYAGDLIWKERDIKLNLIYDAMPISDFINLSGKLIGLLMTYMVLMLTLILSGIIFQTANGYYLYELDVYFYGFFIELFPFLILYTFISFFIQAMVNHKFIGYILVVVFFVLTIALWLFGFDHVLYNFGGPSLGTYSEMNGYGHFLTSYLWIKGYWFLFCIILFIIAVVFLVRGTETSFNIRLKLGRQRLSKPLLKWGGTTMILFILIGSYIFYNTNILNDYWTTNRQIDYRARYEQTLKQFEYLPQPKIVAVNLKVELYPHTRGYTVEGYYILNNTEADPITSIYVQKLIDRQVGLEYVTFEGGAKVDRQYQEYDFYSYALNQPLEAGDSIKMTFKQTFTTRGFVGSGSNINILHNGTFFNNKYFPTLGYNRKYELREDNERQGFGLPPRRMAKRNHPHELKNSRTGDDGNKINFEIIIGTDISQIAIAPGTLQREWQEGGRKYYHYKMNEPMANFYAIISAQYEIKKDTWNPTTDTRAKAVDLEIYYHKGHGYNLDRMMDAMKFSFDYFSTYFSSYPYQQIRIMEFPRYAGFAQSFPNTIPFSEAIGFMLKINDETDVDMAFYITAHELAHQWWGLQLVAANVEGRYMITETLAQYSALMVLKKKYSKEKVQQFLRMEQEAYFRGRLADKTPEKPLVLTDKHYAYYKKGAVNLYALQDYISEDSVNLALRRFMNDWNPFNTSKPKDRYATTDDLVGYLKAVTPDSLQYIIVDLFETVILYDNKTAAANYTEVSTGEYELNLTINAIKYSVDSLGIESAVSMNDWIDIGVYSLGPKGEDELIYLEKHKISGNQQQLKITVDRLPSQAGIDPLNKLMDRNMEDNVILVAK